MRLLLDTHVAIWALTAPEKISAAGRELIGGEENDVFVSAVSIWEIDIKHSLGKESAPPFSAAQAVEYFRQAAYRFLNVTAAHAVAIETLPRLHTDPFDRLLIAQAMIEPLRLLTHDPQVVAYGAGILRV